MYDVDIILHVPITDVEWRNDFGFLAPSLKLHELGSPPDIDFLVTSLILDGLPAYFFLSGGGWMLFSLLLTGKKLKASCS